MNSHLLNPLHHCNLCPRNCNADRFSGKLGWCKSGAGFSIASICNHLGEEPIVSGKNGIVNIFFSHCNLQCIYCQNYQISRNDLQMPDCEYSLDEVIARITQLLDSGCNAVGFVSASHFVPQIKVIMATLHDLGRKPVFVYNTNGYDKVETLKELEGLIDIYLPDFKYFDSELAQKYSAAVNYPDYAKKAIKEMYRQKGSTVILNDETGQAESGLIIRHLVLPGHTNDSIAILRWLADELSTSVHISLMAQYYPTSGVAGHAVLNRSIYADEYQKVTDELENLGFYRGWIQELESKNNYKPDFNKTHPFH